VIARPTRKGPHALQAFVVFEAGRSPSAGSKRVKAFVKGELRRQISEPSGIIAELPKDDNARPAPKFKCASARQRKNGVRDDLSSE